VGRCAAEAERVHSSSRWHAGARAEAGEMMRLIAALVLALYSHCTRTVLALYSHCARTVLTLYSRCTHAVLTLYSRCAHTLLALYSHTVQMEALQLQVQALETAGREVDQWRYQVR
jgi:hypothetical protein